MVKKTFKILAITLILSAILSIPASALEAGGGTESPLPGLRTAPLLTAPLMRAAAISPDLIAAGDAQSDWYGIVYRGAPGFMPAKFLDLREIIEGNLGIAAIIGTDVHVRSGPDPVSGLMGVCRSGEELQVIGISGQWYRIIYNGTAAYVHTDSLVFIETGPPEPTSEELGQIIVDTAMKYLGVRYVWGGASANGFDCSGLVYYAYTENGYSINRTAASIYQNGVYIDKEELQPGDSVHFRNSFNSKNSIGHVGIYIGGGEFIHSSSGSGRVIISRLDEGYYNLRYVGARRMV